MSDVAVIEVNNLTKVYAEQKALNGISFTVSEGEFFTILGPNGAGKTTLIKILTGQLKSSDGKASVMGTNINQLLKSDVKYKISYIPQEQLIWEDLTVAENLTLMGKLYGLKGKELSEKVNRLIEDFELKGHEKKLAIKLSGGMKRKLSIAMALMNDPLLLFLDEPTTGLDVHARTLLIEDLKRLKESGTTLILTTHLMEEAEALSTRVLILNHGEVIAIGNPDELIEQYVGKKILQVGLLKASDEFEEFLNKSKERYSIEDYIRIKDTFFIKGANLHALMGDILQNPELMDDILEIYIKNSTMKETFLFLTRELMDNNQR